MNVSSLFIHRPVMTTLVMLAILLFGILGFRSLPMNALPNVDFPTIQVTASLSGASAQNMAASVATPLEKQFSTIQGVVSMSSSSSLGITSVTLQFELSRDIDAAAEDVQAAITQASPLLPQNLTMPPTYQKVNPADLPVLYLALHSNTLLISDVDEYAETFVAQHLSLLGGVAQVEVFGQQKKALRAQLDPNKLAAYGLGLDDVATAMESDNVELPVGTLYGTSKAYTVATNDQLADAKHFKQMVVAFRNGSPVKLGDLGTIIDGVQDPWIAAWEGTTPAVLLAVQRQPGSNTVQVVDNLRKALPGIERGLPPSLKVDILYDASQSVRDSVHDVEMTLLLTIVLVVVVIFLFLGNLSATWIAGVALPIALVGTFAAMSLLGFSLNNLSLMALTLSVGFVVDDAIVVLENIFRHIEMGEPPMEAAMNGSAEIGFTVISMTLSLVAVFIPVLLMSGIIGRLFREFAVTISVAILVSGVVSLTLTPMLCSRMLKARPSGKDQESSANGRFFGAILKAYDASLQVVLHFRFVTLMISFVLLALTGWLFMVIPKGFMPTEDTGQVVIYTEGAQSASFVEMEQHQQALARIVAQDPNVATYLSSVGTGGALPTGNEGVLLVYLKPTAQRALTADQVVEELRPKLATVTGIKVYPQNPPTISIGGQVTKGVYTLSLESPLTADLDQWTPILLAKIAAIPGVEDANSDLELDSPQANVSIDRDKASELGITAAQVDDALDDAYGNRQISTIFTPTDEFWVVIELEPHFYKAPNQLNLLYVHSSTGKLLPLSTVASFSGGTAPLVVNHLSQLPAATISFNLAPTMALGTVLTKVENLAHSTLPMTVTPELTGTAQAFDTSFAGMLSLLALAMAVIYIVLGVLYESFIHPITILAGLPSAGLGALITLLIFHKPLDIYGFLGLIMLIGIVKKNAIMMIDFAVEFQNRQGTSAQEAIHQACLVRFRPIMMTTMAALMGSIPIAVGWGAGGESRQPLGLAVVGGLMVSQLLTLYITPVVYVYLDRLIPAPVDQLEATP